jgi:hypothetical protein
MELAIMLFFEFIHKIDIRYDTNTMRSNTIKSISKSGIEKHDVIKYTLGIHTNATESGWNPTRGHSWVSITSNKTGNMHTYSLFANQTLPMHESDGTGKIHYDDELIPGKYVWRNSYFTTITQNEYDSIVPYLSNDRSSIVWHTDYTCASYAIDVFNMKQV